MSEAARLEASARKDGARAAQPKQRRRFRGGQLVLKKLSANLLKTYNSINQKYYARKREQLKRRAKHKRNNGWDDDNHDYIIKAQEKIGGRYIVESVIGRGSFGQVVKARDFKHNTAVAIKIVKSKSAFMSQAQIEIRILKSLHDGMVGVYGDSRNIVRLLDTFVHKNHQCLVFELLSFNLYELLRDTGFYGVSLNLIRKFANQLLVTLDYISSHKEGVIHCDLKPENILLRNPKHSAIKVIDFGSACFQSEKMYSYIQSRFYRSPEVLLGCPYNTMIDVWSLGCILVEMHTGKPLFNGASEKEQIVQQVDTLGMPPDWMLEKGGKTKRYFLRSVQGAKVSWKLKVQLSEKEKLHIKKRKVKLEDVLGVKTRGPNGVRRNERIGHTVRDYTRFADLIRRMLDYDPNRRMTPRQALKHKFFVSSCDTGSMTDPVALDSKQDLPVFKPGVEAKALLAPMEIVASIDVPPRTSNSAPPGQTVHPLPLSLPPSAPGQSGLTQDVTEITKDQGSQIG